MTPRPLADEMPTSQLRYRCQPQFIERAQRVPHGLVTAPVHVDHSQRAIAVHVDAIQDAYGVIPLEHLLVEKVFTHLRIDVDKLDHSTNQAGFFVQFSDHGIGGMLAVIDPAPG